MANWFKKEKPWQEQRLLVIDMEMTGLNAQEDSIVSAGCVVIEQGRIQLAKSEHHYFLPTSLMGSDVSDSAHIHMITDTQREEQGEQLSDWFERLNEELKADSWIFHHAQIDMSFLKVFSERLQIKLPKVTVMDTMQIEQQLHADDQLESHAQLNLNACRARYGLPVYRQHHAMSDALATAELFLAQQAYRR